MSNKTLSEEFQSSMGESIEYEGMSISPIFIVELAGEKQLAINWLSPFSEYKQGVRIKIDKGTLLAKGESYSETTQWEDTCPNSVILKCIPKKKAKLKSWNVWDAKGLCHSWLGNTGINISKSESHFFLNSSVGQEMQIFGM
ncbi:hypothetical protein N480_22470 [Pseudoalteromonas luteoviolacea S2607]|uniref:hypothetical protein n=1 Tax=Pseudoalteromonas luteoviolacea TaxID=43657 RepID=UPI0007B051FE|nr:hypothetical protein [Pseudoalteromonas luteoviolacea]KZN34371.1 hypothetical protein N480_22470 [Pseudoalteromonas luteoviolacea S2607]